MSHHASDDSEYCSDFSCDSLNLSSGGRGEDCETVPSENTSVSVNGANDSSEAEVMETDPLLSWHDATETFLRTKGGGSIEVDDSPDPSQNSSFEDARYDQELMQPPNGVNDVPQLFDRLMLASSGITKTARSDDGFNRRKSCNIRESRSWSCLHNMSHRRAKSVPPFYGSKQISYLELFRRKMYGKGTATHPCANMEDLHHLQIASTVSTEEETQPLEPECPSTGNKSILNASDIENVDGKSDEIRDVASEEPCSRCPSEKQFIQAACEFTKSVGEHEAQNKKPCSKRTVNNLKNLRQAPLKLGSLGFDKEAVKEKYERFKKQQCYGEQVSIRNRIKLSQTQKACDKSLEDQNNLNGKKVNESESDVAVKKSGQVSLERRSDSRQKNEMSKSARAKSYSETIRASATVPRRSVLKSVMLPSRDSMDTIKPLVERHMKENEIVDTIRRSFGRTKLNLKQ